MIDFLRLRRRRSGKPRTVYFRHEEGFALALSGLSAAPALAAGPTGWGDFSCMLIAAFPAKHRLPRRVLA